MSTAPETDDTPRRFRFGMAHVFVAMAVGGLLFTIVGGWFHEYRARSYADRIVDKLKGTVTAYHDGVGHIEQQELAFPPLDEEQMNWLEPAWPYLDNIARVSLRDSFVLDDDLPAILTTPSLRSLNLRGTQVTDAGVARLARVTPLGGWRYLNLQETPITDECSAELAGLTSLVELSLAETSVTDATLARLQALLKLEKLSLAHCAISDAGMLHVRELEHLVELNLSHTPITDAGVAHLKRMPRLQALRLGHTSITEASIVSLRRLPRLRTVDLTGTPITADAADRLKRQAPGLIVLHKDKQ